ncbi:MAG: lipid-A-disaccharide synthase N-terminal domain-containing protein, partial [Bacteroidales bacterium]|nr:lipid-A-disaccharide synthase N-terminal domain-containing protein [Bacteroidales bacterium]
IYGLLRNDFSIVLGQFIVYFIYIRNLQLKKTWRNMPLLSRTIAVILPVFCVLWLAFGKSYNISTILKNEEIAFGLMIWGSAGQIIFTFRFFYQWIYSENRNDSLLPVGFWIISTVGSIMIFTYSIYRTDPVLFASHSLGLFIYVRNILICYGKEGFFSKLNRIPFLNKLVSKISEKIK